MKSVLVQSFGYSRGVPGGDLTYDVRFLPDPYYGLDDASRYSGVDARVASYIERSFPEVFSYMDKMVEDILAEAEKGESITVSVGCFGGRFRSVYVVETVTELLRGVGVDVSKRHIHKDSWAIHFGIE